MGAHSTLRVQDCEIRISQDGEGQLLDIRYGLTGAIWVGTMTVRLQPGVDVVAWSSQMRAGEM